jgi:hypothetical protein
MFISIEDESSVRGTWRMGSSLDEKSRYFPLNPSEQQESSYTNGNRSYQMPVTPDIQMTKKVSYHDDNRHDS